MRPQIVLFGDSITEESFRSGGWGASLADTYSRKADVVVRGYDGYNTRWASFLLQHIFPLYKESVAMGAGFGLTWSLYGENAMKQPERSNEVTGVYAKECVELAKKLGVSSVNLWSKMQEIEGWQKKFLSDGLHLTPQGNAFVYQEVARVLEEEGLRAPDMPYDFPHHSKIDGNNPENAFQIQCSDV